MSVLPMDLQLFWGVLRFMHLVPDICEIQSNSEVAIICVITPRVLVPCHCSQVEAVPS